MKTLQEETLGKSFETLLSLITEGITLEYKGQDAIKFPVNKLQL